MAMIVETNYFGGFEQADDPKMLIIPVPYEYTTSYIKGTKNAPQAILNASKHLDSFDEELWVDISKIGINTSNFVSSEFVSNKSKQPFVEIEQAVRAAVINGSMPLVIGGEHSIICGSMKAIYDLFPDVSILHFGARSYLKSTTLENKFSNECIFKRINETMPELKIVQVGIRSLSNEESNWLETSNPNIEIYFSRDRNRWNVADILTNLSKNVYLSFNFNALDSSVMPSASIPEPGGFSFEQACDIIKNVCAFKEIVGMDFVEFSPVANFNAPDFTAAKLIYKSIGYSFARELGAFEEEEATLVSSKL
ncbi:MAG: hypothetical protein A3I68_03570 [Candidatus Melainabacteria bacterium RIFCSPLOWO2_02_FULL_35_15]|nr:MAG: hypothetical protein A3F80_03885 [Candidatus Melainabacteria bacterium RIFCSPLOWO2_12_FULL_35_11]OGI14680.1 MAG: hypothetical protein A3I68_03570 [Candidatus Melainabacteria bacterium RIFCSPLOWO2_02_FULL_35_15]